MTAAAERAIAAASLSVQRLGAIPSIPTRRRDRGRNDQGWADVSGADEPVAERDLLVPRPIDLPTTVPLDAGADLSALDEAKIFAAPRDPGDRERWRDVLTAWRADARTRLGYDGSRVRHRPVVGGALLYAVPGVAVGRAAV